MVDPSLRAPEAIQRHELQQRAGELFFGNVGSVPEPWDVAALLQDGLCESDILAAAEARGYAKPTMQEVLDDLDLTLPYFSQMSDVLAQEHSNSRLVFQDRDAEIMYWNYAIKHGADGQWPPCLMPASSALLMSLIIWGGSGDFRAAELAAEFLDQYGFTREAVEDALTTFTLVDTGLKGSALSAIDFPLTLLYGTSLVETGRMSIRLAGTDRRSKGTQILDTNAPRLSTARLERLPSYNAERFSNTIGLVLSAQLTPRYQGTYKRLDRIDGRVVAVPEDEPIVENVDAAALANNTSIVNPVAAAIVQSRVVRAALVETGQIGPEAAPVPNNYYAEPIARRIARIASGGGRRLPFVDLDADLDDRADRWGW